jgi:DNA-binding transcriptional MerR regulator
MLRASVPLPKKQIAERLRELVEFYKLKYKSYGNLSRLSGVSEHTIRSWSHILDLNPEASNLPNLKLLGEFCYAVGWTLTDMSKFLEGNESVESVDYRLSEEINSFEQKLNSINLEVDNSELRDANIEAHITFHLDALARLTGVKQFFKLPSVRIRVPEQEITVIPGKKFIRFVSPHAQKRLKNLVIESGRKHNWLQEDWIKANCDMSFYWIIFTEGLQYEFTLEALKTLTPHLYEIISWTQDYHPILDTSRTYENREEELINLLENGNDLSKVSTS